MKSRKAEEYVEKGEKIVWQQKPDVKKAVASSSEAKGQTAAIVFLALMGIMMSATLGFVFGLFWMLICAAIASIINSGHSESAAKTEYILSDKAFYIMKRNATRYDVMRIKPDEMFTAEKGKNCIILRLKKGTYVEINGIDDQQSLHQHLLDFIKQSRMENVSAENEKYPEENIPVFSAVTGYHPLENEMSTGNDTYTQDEKRNVTFQEDEW